MRVLKIVSDGTPQNTRVLTTTGEAIDGITAITWHLNARTGRATATLTCEDVEIDADGAQQV